METLKITKGQPFVLYVPLVILNADGSKEAVDAASLTDVNVQALGGCGEYELAYVPYEHYLALAIPECFAPAVYAVTIVATLNTGRKFSLRNKRCFEVVYWDHQANWRNFIIDDHIVLRDQPFIAGGYGNLEPIQSIANEEIDNLFM